MHVLLVDSNKLCRCAACLLLYLAGAGGADRQPQEKEQHSDYNNKGPSSVKNQRLDAWRQVDLALISGCPYSLVEPIISFLRKDGQPSQNGTNPECFAVGL